MRQIIKLRKMEVKGRVCHMARAEAMPGGKYFLPGNYAFGR